MTRFLTLCIALLAGFAGWAQPASANYAPTTAENSLLWEISGNGLTQPSYLFGTIHIIAAEDFLLSDSTLAAFNRCKEVAFEINMDEMDNLGAMLPLLMKAFMRNGTTLRDLLSTEDYNLVKSRFSEMGLPVFMLERVKPMFLSSMVSGPGSDTSALSDTKSYEIELLQLARDADKPVHGLETAAYQMSMFDSIPYKAQAEMLVQTLKAGPSENDEMDQLVALYKAQDLVELQKMMESESGIGEYQHLLLDQRNINWIPVMSRMMKEEPVFFAVGAGHLGGEKGVIALLRRQGYQMRAIR